MRNLLRFYNTECVHFKRIEKIVRIQIQNQIHSHYQVLQLALLPHKFQPITICEL